MTLIKRHIANLDYIIDYSISRGLNCMVSIEKRDNLEEFMRDFRNFTETLPYSKSLL